METHLKPIFIKAACYCSYQKRTHEEVRNKLKQLYVEDNDCEVIISHLIEDNYLNEQRYAETYAGGKFRIKKWGKRKILFELKKKNISDYTLKNSLKDISDKEYHTTLSKLAKSKLNALLKNTSDNLIIKKKLIAYLIQKGYEQELIWSVIKELVP